MPDKLPSYPRILILALLSILVPIGLFYWYQEINAFKDEIIWSIIIGIILGSIVSGIEVKKYLSLMGAKENYKISFLPYSILYLSWLIIGCAKDEMKGLIIISGGSYLLVLAIALLAFESRMRT